LFLSVVVVVAIYGVRTAMKARKVGWSTAKEIPAVYRDGKQPEAQSEA
jgi:carbon starvation protein A